MRPGRLPVYFPVDHRSNFSGYVVDEAAPEDDRHPWPVRRRVAVLLVTALAAWIVILSPFLLID